MLLIYAGLLLFTLIHLMPAAAPGLKLALVARTGALGYRGVFSLLALAGIALIVLGWRNTLPTGVYAPPAELRHAAMALIAAGFLLMVVSARPSAIKRLVRHPQLTGVLLWALGHLLINGDSRSVTVFGALACWSVLQIIAINRREGNWTKDPAPGATSEVITVAITLVAIAVVVAIHPWLSGRAIF
jgi:uncharacterized membrane protein